MNRISRSDPTTELLITTTASPLPSRIAALDGVRGLAVLVVVLHNTVWVGEGSGQFLARLYGAVAATGWVGVQLFFVLSGFLITGILVDSYGAPGALPRFFARRTLRIFPLYFVVIGATMVAAAVAGGDSEWATAALRDQWAYWTYTSNWIEPFGGGTSVLSHVWSLAVEEQFYVLWPLLLRVLGPQRLLAVAAALVVAGPFVRLLLHELGLPAAALYAFTVARIDALALGGVLAMALRSAASLARLQQHAQRILLAALVALLLLLIRQRGFHSTDLPVQIVGQTLVSIISAWVVYWAAMGRAPNSRAAAFLSRSWLPTLGSYSYAMYLLFYPVHRLLQPLAGDWVNTGSEPLYVVRLWLYALLVLAITYLLARITWVVIEAPALRWRDRLDQSGRFAFGAPLKSIGQ